MRFARAWVGVLVGLGLFIGCSSSDEPKKGLSDGCVASSDCAEGLVCKLGHCHAECATSRDCPTGASCVKVDTTTNVCRLPVDEACVYNSDCQPPLVCGVDRKCRNQCQADQDCLYGQICATSKVCAEKAELTPGGDLLPADGGGGTGGTTEAGAGGSGGASGTGGSSGSGGTGGGLGGVAGSVEAGPDVNTGGAGGTGGGGQGGVAGSDAGPDVSTGGTGGSIGNDAGPDAPEGSVDAGGGGSAGTDSGPDAGGAADAAGDGASEASDANTGEAGPTTCQTNGQCASVHCVDGYCCDRPCNGVCEACNLPGLEGICSPIPLGQDPSAECPDTTPCTSTCNGQRACSPVCGAVGAPCLVQGDCNLVKCVDGYCCDQSCTSGCDACNVPGLEGTCSPVAAGQDPRGACDADAPTTCGLDGACDGKSQCEYYGASTPCTDGESICTTGDHCNGNGACVGGTKAPDFTTCSIVTSPDYSYDICVHGKCVSPGTCADATCNTPSFHFPLPDTNQHVCQDAAGGLAGCPGTAGAATCSATDFCGQDAQYGWDLTHSYSARFARAGTWEPTVADSLTGMMWQGCPAGMNGSTCSNGTGITYSFLDAMSYCENSSWGGYTDWRLPDRFETISLADFASDAIDPTAFPNVMGGAASSVPGGGLLWTSARLGMALVGAWCSGSGGMMYTFDFWNVDPSTGGIICAYGGGLTALTTCVRGSGTPRAATRFTRSGDWEPVVSDADTGLVWQGCAAGMNGSSCSTGTDTSRNWHDAMQYCEALVWGGNDDWRLPNVVELTSVTDGALVGAAADATAFPATPTTVAFVSSTSEAISASVRSVNFGDGRKLPVDKATLLAVRCVR